MIANEHKDSGNLDKLLTEEEKKATVEAMAAVPEGNSHERTG